MLSENEARNWAMGAHLAALFGFIIPFGNIIGPLVVWLVKKDESELVDEQGKEALNFQITITIAYIIAFLLILVVIGLFLLPILFILDLIFIIVAAVKTSGGEHYRYPLTLRLVS